MVRFETDGAYGTATESFIYNSNGTPTKMSSTQCIYTPTVSGTHNIRFDSNYQGETHKFWNISIYEYFN